ncbi:MAG TPA: ester cyclase [Bacteroidia bacterium]|nr:ester cyclase [Bacteroidia bacterium]
MKTLTQKLALLLMVVLFTAACSNNNHETDKAAQQAQTLKDNAMKVMAMFESGNPEGCEEYMHTDFTEHTPWPGVEGEGSELFKNIVKTHYAGMSDTKMTVHNISVDGDYMYIHYNMKGTHNGDGWPGMPATNKTIDVDGVDVLKHRDGKVSDHWGYMDQFKMMTQLGMMPEPGAEGAPADSAATTSN